MNTAFSQDYLLYQILAVSALHSFHQDRSRQDLLAKAISYRGLALQKINPALANMTAALCIPVFAFAGLSMVYAFAELVALQHDREGEAQQQQAFDPIRHITGCLQQNFGIRTVVHTYREAIQASWASELININSDSDFALLSHSGLVFAHAEKLHSLIDVHERRLELLVDDDVRNVFALSAALEQRGAKVEVGRNGFEAIAKLDEVPGIDLVLMDIMMPGMDGMEATRRIRADGRFDRLPIIAITAKAMKDDQEQCLAAGANDYLAKPIDLSRLYSLLRVWMPTLERI